MSYDPLFEHKANMHFANGYRVAHGIVDEKRVKPLAYEENHMVQYMRGYNQAKDELMIKLLEGRNNER